MSKSKKKSKVVKPQTATDQSPVAKKATKKKPIHAKLIKKKPYLEFVTAFLSIPVLITVMLLNVNTLKNINAKPTPTPSPGVTRSGFYGTRVGTVKPTATFTGSQSTCTKGIGPISIDTPNEGDSVADNPVNVNITYDDSTYCEAVWSYRINGGSWSDYDNRSLALYNLPQGAIKLDLQVKSIVTSDQKVITRNFTYTGTNSVLVPNVTQASSSAQ